MTKKFDIIADIEKHVKSLDKSLITLKEEARDNDAIFEYQTLLFTLRRKLENLKKERL